MVFVAFLLVCLLACQEPLSAAAARSFSRNSLLEENSAIHFHGIRQGQQIKSYGRRCESLHLDTRSSDLNSQRANSRARENPPAPKPRNTSNHRSGPLVTGGECGSRWDHDCQNSPSRIKTTNMLSLLLLYYFGYTCRQSAQWQQLAAVGSVGGDKPQCPLEDRYGNQGILHNTFLVSFPSRRQRYAACVRQKYQSPGFVAFLLVCLLASQVPLPAGAARVRHYRWEVSQKFQSPDCFKKLVVAVNGQTPGPPIRAQQGDTVVVEVKNSLLEENTAIHFHGIRQIGTPWSDGSEAITQCPILPGETFLYKFIVDRPGSYVYHAHYGMQRSAGLYGSIQVDLPDGELEPFQYDNDRTIILLDWWHKSTIEQSVGLSSIPFGWVMEPQSLLINGRGRFNCAGLTSDVCNTTNPECAPYTLNVVEGKTYRLRVSSMTSLSALNFEIEGHNLTVVEADGHYVQPFLVKNLNIYSGESYSVLITANQDPTRNYWIASNVVSRKPNTTTGLGILHYHRTTPPRRLPPTTPPTGPLWNDTAYRLSQSQLVRARQGYAITPPLKADRVMVFLNTQNEIDGYRRWSVNNVSFTHPQTPYLVALKHGLLDTFSQAPPPETYNISGYDIYAPPPNKNASYSNGIYRLEFNSTVDVILQNANSLVLNNSETHPWHLHGHDFWVLAYGEGKFDPVQDPKRYNLVDPIMKNTVAVHPYGWTAIRFRADNPGVWAFHCHIESHFFLGMGVVFAEGIDRLEKLPRQIMWCGESIVRSERGGEVGLLKAP